MTEAEECSEIRLRVGDPPFLEGLDERIVRRWINGRREKAQSWLIAGKGSREVEAQKRGDDGCGGRRWRKSASAF
jgi:hypothetical protein